MDREGGEGRSRRTVEKDGREGQSRRAVKQQWDHLEIYSYGCQALETALDSLFACNPRG